MSETMRDKAVQLAKQGFKVFPLKAGTKDQPIIPPVSGDVPKGQYFDRVPSGDPPHVRAMWSAHGYAEGNPLNHNIGICCNDLLVVDIDNKNGKLGDATWGALIYAHRAEPTVTAETPTGGRHLFYQLPAGVTVKSTIGKLGDGIDVRGWHGYVVAPGSRTADGEYRWRRAPNDEFWGVTQMTPAPATLIELCRAEPRKEKQAAVIAGLELDTPEAIDRAVQWLANDAPEAVENAGGDAMTFQVACRVKDMGLSEPTCLEVLAEHWNPEKAHPPWAIEELERKVANAYAYGTEPIGIKAAEAQFEAVDIEGTETESGPNSSSGANVPHLFPRKRAALFWRTHDESRLRGMKDDFNALIGGYLERNAMSVLYGDSGTGKTFIALDLAYHIAMRRDWNGRKVKGGPVVYVAAEAGESINARIAALHEHHQPEKEPPFAVVPCLVDLFNPRADLHALIALLADIAKAYGEQIIFIVLDTLARIMGSGDENSAREMGILVQNIDRLRVATGAHVMLVHHSGKNKANGARGSSALRAAVDTELEVEGGRIKMRKQRGTEEAKDISFRLRTMVLGKNLDGDTVTSCVVDTGAAVAFELQSTPEEDEDLAKLDTWLDMASTPEFTLLDIQAVLTTSHSTAKRRIETWTAAGKVELLTAGGAGQGNHAVYLRKSTIFLVGHSRS